MKIAALALLVLALGQTPAMAARPRTLLEHLAGVPSPPAPQPADWALASDSGRVSNFHPGFDMAAWIAAARHLGPRGEIRDVTITTRHNGGVSAKDELRKYIYEPRVSRSGLLGP